MTRTTHELDGRSSAVVALAVSPSGDWVGLRRGAVALFQLLRLALTIVVHGRRAWTYDLDMSPSRRTTPEDKLEQPSVHHVLDLPADDQRIAILRRAANNAGTTLHEFVLESALVDAERTLADRRQFTASPEQHEAFLRLLDEPMDNIRLSALAARRSVFGKPFDLSA